MRRTIAAVSALLIMVFGFGAGAFAGDDDCRPADNLTYVEGVDECLALRTYLPSDTAPGKTLVIVLHGDLSRGGPADYIFPVAEQAAAAGAIGVAMMRPGYTGGSRTSTGIASRKEKRAQIYTPDEMDEIAAAATRLKAHHGAAEIVMVGHSGGAVMAGVILGRHPGLVQRALLIACPCDIPTWRRMRGRNPLPNAENPIDHIDRIPAGTVIRLLTGSKDTNTRTSLAADYAEKAQAAGLDTVFSELPGAGHNLTDAVAGSAQFEAALAEVILGR